MDTTDLFTEARYLWQDAWASIVWDARAMLTGKGGTAYVKISLQQRVMERDQQTCQICRHTGTAEKGPDGNPWEIDHYLAYSQGGPTAIDNLRLACANCNRHKAAR